MVIFSEELDDELEDFDDEDFGFEDALEDDDPVGTISSPMSVLLELPEAGCLLLESGLEVKIFFFAELDPESVLEDSCFRFFEDDPEPELDFLSSLLLSSSERLRRMSRFLDEVDEPAEDDSLFSAPPKGMISMPIAVCDFLPVAFEFADEMGVMETEGLMSGTREVGSFLIVSLWVAESLLPAEEDDVEDEGGWLDLVSMNSGLMP